MSPHFASTFAKDAPPAETRKEYLYTPVSDPVDTLNYSKTHPQSIVNQVLRQWKFVVEAARMHPSGQPGREVHRREGYGKNSREVTEITPGGSNIGFVKRASWGLKYINEWLYQVMLNKNPYIPLPFDLLWWMGPTFKLPFFDLMRFVNNPYIAGSSGFSRWPVNSSGKEITSFAHEHYPASDYLPCYIMPSWKYYEEPDYILPDVTKEEKKRISEAIFSSYLTNKTIFSNMSREEEIQAINDHREIESHSEFHQREMEKARKKYNRPMTPSKLALYNRLWEAPDADFPQALAEYDREVRGVRRHDYVFAFQICLKQYRANYHLFHKDDTFFRTIYKYSYEQLMKMEFGLEWLPITLTTDTPLSLSLEPYLTQQVNTICLVITHK